LNARGRIFFWEHVRTTSVLIGGMGVVLGPALDTQLLSVSQRQLMRGFEAAEFLARAQAYLIAEQRLKVLSGMFENVLHYTYLKAIEVVPFAAGAIVTGRDRVLDFSGRGHFLGEIGIGQRLLHQYVGVQPGVVSIDFALPFGRI